MRVRSLVWLVVGVGVVAGRDASAIRPFDGGDASVADTGVVELELGPVDWIGAEGTHVYAPPAALNVGVARDWELSLSAQPLWQLSEGRDHRFGLLDESIAVKRIVREGSLQGGSGPSVAVEVAALLPASDPLNRFGARVAPAVSHAWNGFTVHGSLGVLWTRQNEVATIGAVIVEAPEIAAGLRPGFEAAGAWERHYGDAWSGLAALLWSPFDHVTFDAGYRVARAADTTAHEIRAGLTWAFQVWHPSPR